MKKTLLRLVTLVIASLTFLTATGECGDFKPGGKSKNIVKKSNPKELILPCKDGTFITVRNFLSVGDQMANPDEYLVTRKMEYLTIFNKRTGEFTVLMRDFDLDETMAKKKKDAMANLRLFLEVDYKTINNVIINFVVANHADSIGMLLTGKVPHKTFVRNFMFEAKKSDGPQETYTLVENDRYCILFSREKGGTFWLDFGHIGGKNVMRNTRYEAELKFLELLRISRREACGLQVESVGASRARAGDSPLIGRNFGLSFCPGSKRF